MFKKFFEKKEAHKDAVNKAREQFTSWLEIAKSAGWKVYQERVEMKINGIKHQLENSTDLSGDDLKKLQLALQVWKQVQRIPKELEDNAKGGIK